MGLPELIAALERDADAEIHRIKEQARARAARIEAETHARIQQRRAERLATLEAALRRQGDEALARARRQLQTNIFEARARMLDRVFTRATEAFPDVVRRPAFDHVLRTSLETLLAAVGDEQGTIHCLPILEARVRNILQSRPGVSVQSRSDVGHGLRWVSREGRVVLDDTLECKLERLRTSLAITIMERVEKSP